MYTLHKLLKGGRKEEKEKSSEFLTQKENEDIVNILVSTGTGTLGRWVGGCVTVGGSGKDKQACLCFHRRMFN